MKLESQNKVNPNIFSEFFSPGLPFKFKDMGSRYHRVGDMLKATIVVKTLEHVPSKFGLPVPFNLTLYNSIENKVVSLFFDNDNKRHTLDVKLSAKIIYVDPRNHLIKEGNELRIYSRLRIKEWNYSYEIFNNNVCDFKPRNEARKPRKLPSGD